tara:strand:- start:59 stop:541 length:483 start_codon:yes stop_codon:yes gene_type:complete
VSRVVVNEIQAKVGNDISFNDAAKIDTLKGKTTAGSITVQSEGSATTNLQQGLCKAWSLYNHSTENTLDSFNQSSAVDTSTGVFTWAVTNNFSSVNWVASSSTHADNANNAHSMVHSGTRTSTGTAVDKATTGTSWYAKNSSHSGFDSKLAGYMAFGDLA